VMGYCEVLLCWQISPCPLHDGAVAREASQTAQSFGYSSMHVVIDKKQHTMSTCLSQQAPSITSRTLRAPLAGFVLFDVLSGPECTALQAQLQQHGLQYEFWNPQAPEKRDLRNAETLEVRDESLADEIWQRVKDFVEQRIVVGDDDDRFECGLEGTWVACGINPVMLYGRYAEGCHFSPHSDGNNVIDFNNRSLYTVIIYLTTCPDGGSTNLFSEHHEFLVDDEGRKRFPIHAVTDSAQVTQGSLLAFRQDHLHEGEPVGPGCEKVIIRTDVMYTRIPPVCVDETGLEAYRLYNLAQVLEGQGKYPEASATYKQANRLSPLLAKMLRFV